MEPAQIEAAPHIGSRLNTDFIKGMGKVDGRFIMILDIDRVFSSDELVSVHGQTTD
jgi:purine-binding chemotaxis protein CheW